MTDCSYNGMPIGCSDDEFPWGKNTPSPLDSKYLYGKCSSLFSGYFCITLTHVQVLGKDGNQSLEEDLSTQLLNDEA